MSMDTADDDLLRRLRNRATERGLHEVTAEGIATAESQLGFRLPPLLRRVYEMNNGGVGPGLQGLFPMGEGEDTLEAVYRSFADPSFEPEPGQPTCAQYPWPARLLPICDWGCAMWSCLDCGVEDGAIVTASNGLPFVSTGHTLRSWLSAWLDGVDLFEEMFEPAPSRAGINPFTKRPIVLEARGKPRGMPWP